jgi:excisionase family DNA binding protein
MPQPKVLTVADLSNYLHVHRSTIYRLLRNRELPAFRVGGDWRFNIEMIDEWRMGKTVLPQRPRSEPGNWIGRRSPERLRGEPSFYSRPRRGQDSAFR